MAQWLLQRAKDGKLTIPPVVLLLDITMPILNGTEMVKLWRLAEVSSWLERAFMDYCCNCAKSCVNMEGIGNVIMKPLLASELQKALPISRENSEKKKSKTLGNRNLEVK